MSATPKKVKPDIKGRISLGKLAKGVSSFAVSKDSENRIILVPYTEIPAREKWVYTNKKTLNKLKRGIEDAANERTSSLGDFTQYTEDDSE
ncbi:MAG: hypothetical protein K0U29_03350 [Gammaproteobacteria bacterium]|nr:hypothetical protein [Gammaproteobacteria bacterium]MCH9743948.1 hypothetical protein [Gammaproteobacteria bacterium]